MAAAGPMQGLQEEATCPICLEYYKDPVTTKCGHNFCRACITGCSEGGGTALPCPQCREICPQGDLRTNRQLQSIVEFVKQLSVQQKRPQEEEGLCEEHAEWLKLFCEEDKKLICLICQLTSEHKTHNVRPLKEAAQEYKRKLQDWQGTLRAERDAVLQTKLKEEQDCRSLRIKLEEERAKLVAEFENLQQLLKEQERTLLERLEEVDRKIAKVENAGIAKLSAEVSSLEGLITEIEKKCEQPPGELLKDVRSTLSRCEHTSPQTPEAIRKRFKEPITLDAETAYASLTLSEGGRRVTNRRAKQTPLEHPKRFTNWHSVPGTEGFTSGRHYWELEILQDRGWRLGVSQESVSRKNQFPHCPESGLWVVQWYNNEYAALTSPPHTLSPSRPPPKLGVYLDYEGGQVSLYNADSMELVYAFTGAAFSGRVYPYFNLYPGTDLHLV